ncbi:RDD family protein [Pedobacter sp. HDW13]|uniref:RDD family protein n=1 Tax=unclassified Pedobacter TaxID=2628915 RepID=UPI000F5A77D0|nr:MULTISPECIES: RDD family protein [unclassified Pedobacter]QIL38671.1 RDD family protein [Pedobacter sp. HDW13]RQO80166.1 RDD family protein [Pedobacter sp. KBW01]
MNPNKEYTVVINGKPQGPYSLTDLKDLDIKPNTFIRKPGMDDYKEAHAIPELRELLGFSYQKTAPQYFAAFDQRLLASVIDHFIIFGFYTIIILTSYIFIEGKDQRIMTFLVPFPIIFVVKLIYGSIAEATKSQATIGKKLLNIKVAGMDGSRVSFGISIVRNFSKILSVIPVFFGYLYSFLNKKNQCWHDITANTLVIKDRLI